MFEFSLPTRATTVPSGPDWIHEIKFDGYRLRLERDGDPIRLMTRGRYNWADRYPWIVETARKIRQRCALHSPRPFPGQVPSYLPSCGTDRRRLD
jgi:ATP-dependent DNA ligase